jgi:hypothetical protein
MARHGGHTVQRREPAIVPDGGIRAEIEQQRRHRSPPAGRGEVQGRRAPVVAAADVGATVMQQPDHLEIAAEDRPVHRPYAEQAAVLDRSAGVEQPPRARHAPQRRCVHEGRVAEPVARVDVGAELDEQRDHAVALVHGSLSQRQDHRRSDSVDDLGVARHDLAHRGRVLGLDGPAELLGRGDGRGPTIDGLRRRKRDHGAEHHHRRHRQPAIEHRYSLPRRPRAAGARAMPGAMVAGIIRRRRRSDGSRVREESHEPEPRSALGDPSPRVRSAHAVRARGTRGSPGAWHSSPRTGQARSTDAAGSPSQGPDQPSNGSNRM